MFHHTTESIDRELKRINSTIPTMLKQQVVSDVDVTPGIKLLMETILEKSVGDVVKNEHTGEEVTITAELQGKARRLMDTGKITLKKPQQNAKIAALIDRWVQREIKKSVKEGRLPTRKQLAIIMKKDNENK